MDEREEKGREEGRKLWLHSFCSQIFCSVCLKRRKAASPFKLLSVATERTHTHTHTHTHSHTHTCTIKHTQPDTSTNTRGETQNPFLAYTLCICMCLCTVCVCVQKVFAYRVCLCEKLKENNTCSVLEKYIYCANMFSFLTSFSQKTINSQMFCVSNSQNSVFHPCVCFIFLWR